MFYSTAIPGILTTKPVRGIAITTEEREKVYVSMSRDNAGDTRECNPPRGGEATNLSMLYEQFRRPIHSYIYRLLGNLEDADDLTQEVFVRACMAWDRLYERGNLSAWLYRIATNLCVDVLRRRKRISWWPLTFRRDSDDRLESDGNDAESWLLPDSGGIPEIAEREHIQMALNKLPTEYAVALVLSASQGVSYQEIAVIVGISPNAAATRISRAKKMFAEQYQRINQESVAKEERQR